MAYQQQESIDLGQLFGAVLGTLQQNRQELNQADELNHDHGDNMVDTFRTITQAVNETQGAAPSDQLAYAADVLSQHPSGSAQMYSRGLFQAANEFQGQTVNRGNALDLIQMLLGGGQAHPVPQQQSAGGLGGLLGTLMGGSQPPQQQAAPGLGDLLGTLLGGGQQQQQPQPQSDGGVDMGDILRAGMAFMTAKMSGKNNFQALVSAIVAGSAMNSGYREQSSSLVTNALLSVVQSMVSGR